MAIGLGAMGSFRLPENFRESFRPFAPAVLREQVEVRFEHEGDSPCMLVTAGVRKERRRELTSDEQALRGLEMLKVPRSTIPAVTHVDGSARVQTVRREANPRFHAILSAFRDRTGCPVVVNTSFDVRGGPIVCTPEDAWSCFMRTAMDALVLEAHVLLREEQPECAEAGDPRARLPARPSGRPPGPAPRRAPDALESAAPCRTASRGPARAG